MRCKAGGRLEVQWAHVCFYAYFISVANSRFSEILPCRIEIRYALCPWESYKETVKKGVETFGQLPELFVEYPLKFGCGFSHPPHFFTWPLLCYATVISASLQQCLLSTRWPAAHAPWLSLSTSRLTSAYSSLIPSPPPSTSHRSSSPLVLLKKSDSCLQSPLQLASQW